jgi:molybdate transport repressor ModE-like protein
MAPRPKTLDTALVQALVNVADTGSITAAARDLHYSQPGLTQRIQTLEHVLGCRLFDRTPTGVHPTEKGTAVLPYARMLLAITETMHREAARPIPDGTNPADHESGTEDPPPQPEEPT